MHSASKGLLQSWSSSKAICTSGIPLSTLIGGAPGYSVTALGARPPWMVFNYGDSISFMKKEEHSETSDHKQTREGSKVIQIFLIG